MRVDALHLLGDDVPVHSGHLVIENDGIDVARKKQPEPFIATTRFQDLIAILFEQHLPADEAVPVIVDAKNGRLGARHGSLHSNQARVDSFSGVTSRRGKLRWLTTKWWAN